jgi:hypothetical protein
MARPSRKLPAPPGVPPAPCRCRPFVSPIRLPQTPLPSQQRPACSCVRVFPLRDEQGMRRRQSWKRRLYPSSQGRAASGRPWVNRPRQPSERGWSPHCVAYAPTSVPAHRSYMEYSLSRPVPQYSGAAFFCEPTGFLILANFFGLRQVPSLAGKGMPSVTRPPLPG